MKNKIKEIEYDFDWFEWCINIKCKCGTTISLTDDSFDKIICPKCKREYKIYFNTKVKEIK
jgi:hypothetical protein